MRAESRPCRRERGAGGGGAIHEAANPCAVDCQEELVSPPVKERKRHIAIDIAEKVRAVLGVGIRNRAALAELECSVAVSTTLPIDSPDPPDHDPVVVMETRCLAGCGRDAESAFVLVMEHGRAPGAESPGHLPQVLQTLFGAGWATSAQPTADAGHDG
jgi:hypothetical protein